MGDAVALLFVSLLIINVAIRLHLYFEERKDINLLMSPRKDADEWRSHAIRSMNVTARMNENPMSIVDPDLSARVVEAVAAMNRDAEKYQSALPPAPAEYEIRNDNIPAKYGSQGAGYAAHHKTRKVIVHPDE